MRYPASEKLEIIRLVEESHLSARLTLAKLGILKQRESIKRKTLEARRLHHRQHAA